MRLFIYGTLRDCAVQERQLGRVFKMTPDILDGYALSHHIIEGDEFPVLDSDSSASVAGETIGPLTENDFVKLDEWETDAYQRIAVRLRSGVAAWVYVRGIAGDDRCSDSAGTARERDPHGKSPHDVGAKLDEGKVRPELVIRGFANALYHVACVGTYGANKYRVDGWSEVPDGVQRYTDAMYRHLLAEHRGELVDPDSHLLHAAQAAWNSLARLELMLRDD